MITLWAFGDSHTAGAEIDQEQSGRCESKAYPKKLADLQGWQCVNLARSGGSNGWILRELDRVKDQLDSEQSRVLINWCDPSRCYHCDEQGQISHLTASRVKKGTRQQRQWYYAWLKSVVNKDLDELALDQIRSAISILSSRNIDYCMHVSTHWYKGTWQGIDQSRFFGHNKDYYTVDDAEQQWRTASYWGQAQSLPEWQTVAKTPRWHGHFPEEYHEYWANKLADFWLLDKEANNS